jgi:cysteinyl-tRNA synthetase
MLGVLGLGHLLDVTTETAPDDALQLATERAAARERRDFAEADRLRDELHSRGWEVRDGPSGPELVPRS